MECEINELSEILQYAVSDIHNLDEYYNNQLNYVVEHTRREFPKYYRGIVLGRFFISKLNEESINGTETNY